MQRNLHNYRLEEVKEIMIRVLFVCHGNICRSPMAEFICKDMVEKMGATEQFVIASAATSTEEIYHGRGNPVYPPAKRELNKHGIDCEGKCAVQLQREDYERYDYLIGMDDKNIRNIEAITGHRGGKIHMLLEFAKSSSPISDPWYTNRFEETYQNIVVGCQAFLSYLKQTGELI